MNVTCIKRSERNKILASAPSGSQLVNSDFSIYLKNADEIVNILSAIVKTSQSK